MTVYVDDMNAKYKNLIMCHLCADTTEELYDMADKLELKRIWIQNKGMFHEHFDVSAGKKELAIKLGAKEMTPEELVTILWENRKSNREAV